AFEAIQQMALDSDAEEATTGAVTPQARVQPGVCPVCHAVNLAIARFCSACGAPMQSAQGESHAPASKGMPAAGAHHYHHHYHHHYFSANGGAVAAPETQSPLPATNVREAVRRPAQPGAPLSRAEIAVRKI